MPKAPWKSSFAPQPDRTYVALLSYLPLRRYRAMPKFFRFSREIMRQLASSHGLIGYALDAHVFARRFWTLSAWENQQALNDFVHRLPHSRIMQDLASDLGKTQFAQWQVSGADIPLDWSSAKARLSR